MVTINTGSGSTLAAAIRTAVVAFQADDFEPVAMTGGSVTITGQARLVDDPEEIVRLVHPHTVQERHGAPPRSIVARRHDEREGHARRGEQP